MSEHSAPGSRTVMAVVIAAVVSAIVVGVVMFLLLGGKDDNADQELAAANAKIEEQAKQIGELTSQSGLLQKELDKLKGQLKHQKEKGQKAEEQANQETSTDLEDGRYIAEVKVVDTASAPQTITVDVMQWFTGNAANKAAKEDGEETPVPNDYYIRNESKQLRTLDVRSGCPVKVTYWHKDTSTSGKSITFEQFGNLYQGSAFWQKANQQTPYWITLEGGEVTKIEAQFIP